MGSEVPILEFSTGPLVGRGSWPVGAGTHLPCPTLRTSQGPGGRPVTQCPSPLGLRRVRSIIMLQEKAQDRERLLLKFIKIMKVTWGLIQRGDPRPSAPSLTAASPSLQHLRKLNNFNSYLAILSALDSAPIRRLEWQKQTSEVGGCCLVSSHWALWAREAVPGSPAPQSCAQAPLPQGLLRAGV